MNASITPTHASERCEEQGRVRVSIAYEGYLKEGSKGTRVIVRLTRKTKANLKMYVRWIR